MSRFDYIAYAQSFASFLLPKLNEFTVKDILLFGSVLRDNFDEESDIDLFINLQNENEAKIVLKIVREELQRFYKSYEGKRWSLKGIKNEFSIKAGDLDKWKLKRSVISEGIVVYGKYKEIPEKLSQYVLIQFKPIKNTAKRNKIIRKLSGRREIGYSQEGLLKQINGKMLSHTLVLVPYNKADVIVEVFQKEKADFKIFEIWSDQFS